MALEVALVVAGEVLEEDLAVGEVAMDDSAVDAGEDEAEDEAEDEEDLVEDKVVEGRGIKILCVIAQCHYG